MMKVLEKKASSKSKEKKSEKSSKSKDKDKKSDKEKKSDKDKKSDKASSKSRDKDKKSDKSKSKDKKKDDDTKSAKSSKSDKSKSSKTKDKKKTEEKKEEPPVVEANLQGGLPDPSKVDAMANAPFIRGGTEPKPSSSVQSTCLIHGKDLQFYCENTESLICYDCTVMGPHNTQLHRISKMDEAFAFRFQTLNKTIHDSLVPKRTQLVG